MSHLDEGILHALLDGELDATDLQHIHAHLGQCRACETRLDEVRTVRGEADRLIESLGGTAGIRPPAARTPTAAAPANEDEPDHLLLLLDHPDPMLQRQQRLRTLGWAATIAIAVGITYLFYDTRRQAQLAILEDPGIEQQQQPPVLAMSRSDSAVLSDAERPVAEVASAPQPAAKVEDQAPASPPPAAEPAKPAAASAEAVAARAEQREAGRMTEQLRRERVAAQREADRLAEERVRRDADLEAQRRAVPQPPPAPPSIEERAQIYERIGLDEAIRQLGSPMHVIEGMPAPVVGLAQGRTSPGMDGNRPVVRAAYLNSANRLILLDQQRLRSGQTAPAETSTRRVIGDIVVQVHGEVNPTALQGLVARIQ